MEEIGFKKDKVIKEVEANNHNNTTSTYELLRSKLKGTGEIIPMKKDKKESGIKINSKNINSGPCLSNFYDDPEQKERAKNIETNFGKNILSTTMDYKAQNKKFLSIFKNTDLDEEKISKMSLIELFERERTNFILK